MATNFPSSLDSFTNPTAVDTLDSPPHDTQHADANDAIEALQAKVGVDGSAVTTSLDYKVANLESRPVETKTASYTLVAGDVNKRIVMNSASATTITVDTGIFSAGDTVWIHNIGAGTCTVTAGTATVNTAGSLDVGQWEGGSLYFTSASSAIFFRGGGVTSITASGGTEVTSGGYKYHTFTLSGTLTVSKAGLCEVLVVAGGGAGRSTVATQPGPGGGAGGLINASDVYLAAGSHTVTVGAGGAGASSVAVNNCTSGSESSIGSLTAVGGGACQDRVGTKGGSGSGGGTYATPGDGVSGQGNSGGGVAGGGGGAGAAGSAGYIDGSSLRYGGNGGDGLQFSAWATATSTGDSGYYAGGGGGAYGDFAGTGGAGGGGDAQSNSGSAQSGTANTGGGGGGAELNASPSGNGGSGIVIVRYAV